MKKVSYIIVIALGLTALACGKHSKPNGGISNKLNRYLDAQVEGNFTAAEKTLGASFCAAFAYKKGYFPNAYGTGSIKKKFNFDMEQKLCTNEGVAKIGGQLLVYSTANGLSYESAGAPGIVPFVETDTSGVFATYCANQNQNSRVYSSGSEVRVYHFFSGNECGGDGSQVCAVYEKAAADLVTNHYKRMVISTGSFLGYDLRGQEVFSEEQGSCGGSLQFLNHTLRSIQN